MKRNLLIAALIPLSLMFAGCDDDDNIIGTEDTVPAAPQGVFSVTGDDQVFLYFYGPYERDIDRFGIYRSLNETTGYTEIGQVVASDNPNLDLIIYEYIDNNVTNGVTYYYAVSSIDNAGQESDLSAENVFDTPRPQGEAVLFPREIVASASGFNFESGTVLADTSVAADVYIDIFNGVNYLNARDANTDLQDMGYTSSFDDIGFAPGDGWSELGYVELILGHTYIVWTRDNHYAKFRVRQQNLSGSLVCEWAWQGDTGNPELIARPPHGPNYLRNTNNTHTGAR